MIRIPSLAFDEKRFWITPTSRFYKNVKDCDRFWLAALCDYAGRTDCFDTKDAVAVLSHDGRNSDFVLWRCGAKSSSTAAFDAGGSPDFDDWYDRRRWQRLFHNPAIAPWHRDQSDRTSDRRGRSVFMLDLLAPKPQRILA